MPELRVPEWVRPLAGVVGERRRRCHVTDGRAHIELRTLGADERAALARRLDEAYGAVRGVAWAELHPFVHRLVVAFDPAECALDELVARLVEVERACGIGDRPFPSEGPEHPGDLEPLVRAVLELGGDVAGLWLAVVGRVLALPVPPLLIDAVALFGVLEGMPRLRGVVEERLGTQTASLVLGVASALSHGLAQRPSGPLVDIAHRCLQIGERLGRRRVWQARAADLCAEPTRAEPDADFADPRPAALPPGAIEAYTEAAFAGALGAFGLGMAATGSLAGATTGLVGGVPKAARLGREAFATLLGRMIAARGVLTLDPAALRQLDRIDRLVMAADVRATPAGHALAAIAEAAGIAVVTPPTPAEAPSPDDATALLVEVRALQRAGQGVMLVDDRRAAALRAADCGVGLVTPGRTPPWGAHVLGGRSLEDVRVLVEACAAARTVARQSVWLTEAGIGAGVLLSFGSLGAMAAERVTTAVNVAALAAMANGVRLAWSIDADAPRLPSADATPWHRLAVDEVLARLGTSLAGLADDEAARRRVPEPPHPSRLTTLGRAFADQLATPLTPFLAAGAGLAAVAGSVVDAALVGGVTAVNAALGAVQRVRTDAAIADLDEQQAHVARVRRAGRVLSVDAAALVPGDVVALQAGDLVRADCRVAAAVDLEVDESSVTGESLPVGKSPEPCDADALADRTSMLWAGTAVAAGHATGIVVAVGRDTEMRRASAVRGAAPRSGVEARLESLVAFTGPAAALSGITVAAAGLVRGLPLREVLSAGVSLAMAAVPEGLPVLATVGQLAAARRLSRRGALVRNPRALDALGRVDVVCLDKTGTLTEGNLSVRVVSDGSSDAELGAEAPYARAVVTCALRATPETRDGRRLPHLTDRAIADAAARVGAERGAAWQPVAELPFENRRPYHAVLGRDGERYLLCVKGAPDVLLPRCSHLGDATAALDDTARAAVERHVAGLAGRGLRLLAVAERPLASNGRLDDARVDGLVLRGFVGLGDPVRDAATTAIEGLRRAGVRTVMITGDHPATAETIAAQLGIDDRTPLTGPAIDALDDAALAAAVATTGVYARVTPAHKARIVTALQRSGHVVAMTGDGANDAAAIRLADVGIALARGGSGAGSVARGAADLVVTDDRIETVVDAVLEGRALWVGVRDAIAILVGGNLSEIAFTLGTGVLAKRAAFNARQLLLVNLLTDALPAMAVAGRPPASRDPALLRREGPEASLGDALERAILERAVVTLAGTSAAWALARLTGGEARAGTVSLVTLVTTQLGQTLASGGGHPLVVATTVGSFLTLGTIVQTPGLSGLFGCRPLGPLGWTIALGSAGAANAVALLRPGWIAAAMPSELDLQALVEELRHSPRRIVDGVFGFLRPADETIRFGASPTAPPASSAAHTSGAWSRSVSH